MSKLSVEAKVGFFVVVAIAVLGYMSIRVGRFDWASEKGYDVYVYFDSAAGLNVDVPVKIAGVEVGRVKNVTLEKDRARVAMTLLPRIRLTKDAEAMIRTQGILGDKYVELVPGSPAAPPLKDGGRIVRTYSPPDMDTLLKQISEIAGDIRRVSQSLAGAVGGEQGQENLEEIISNMRQMAETLNHAVSANQAQASAIIGNLADFSVRLRDLGEQNEQDIREIVVAMKEASQRLETTLGAMSEVSEKINKGEGTLGQLVNDDETVQSLNATLSSLESITQGINRGEGTIGRLVKDDETIDQINEALTGINQYLGKQDTFRTYLSYSGEYLAEDDSLKSYVTLRIQPKEDKYYLLQVVDDPWGKETITDTTVTSGGVTVKKHRVEVEQNELKFSAQVAKRYHDLVLRAGIMENTGGLGLDYFLLRDRLCLSLEAFDFDPDYKPHLKFKADYMVFPHLYINTGVDDFISDRGRKSFFAGVGISFADEDIKTLMSSVPIP